MAAYGACGSRGVYRQARLMAYLLGTCSRPQEAPRLESRFRSNFFKRLERYRLQINTHKTAYPPCTALELFLPCCIAILIKQRAHKYRWLPSEGIGPHQGEDRSFAGK